jgi:hypothetical protein
MILGNFILHSKDVLRVVSYDRNNLIGPHKEGCDRIQCELARIRRPFETATVFFTGWLWWLAWLSPVDGCGCGEKHGESAELMEKGDIRVCMGLHSQSVMVFRYPYLN